MKLLNTNTPEYIPRQFLVGSNEAPAALPISFLMLGDLAHSIIARAAVLLNEQSALFQQAVRSGTIALAAQLE